MLSLNKIKEFLQKGRKLNVSDHSDKKSASSVFLEDAIFLVSYPKSGNTWLRFLVSNYLTNNDCDFTNHHELIPDIHCDDIPSATGNRPKIIKSHFSYMPEYEKVIYLARDGRDVAVSYFYHLQKYNVIDQGIAFSDFLKVFHSGMIDNFGNWGSHVDSWLDSNLAASDRFLLLKYEDLLKNTLHEFLKVLSFMNINIDLDLAMSAVEFSSFGNMKKLELEQHRVGKHLKTSNPDLRFVRSGKSNVWRDLFSEEDSRIFHEIHGLALKRLDYM